MIWAFIGTIISLIQVISSGPHYRPVILSDARRAQLADTSSLLDIDSVKENSALSFSGYEDRKEQNLYHLIPNLDQSHVTRLFESHNQGPYFWENEFFKSNIHASWEAMVQMKRKRSQVSIMEQVQIIEVECAVLRRELKSHQELNILKDRVTGDNAYRILKSYLKRMSYVLSCLFHPEKHVNDGILRNRGLPYKELWKHLLADVSTTIENLKHILLNFQSTNGSSGWNPIHTLITEVLSIFNFLFINNLVSEDVLQKMLKQGRIMELVSKDIIEVFRKKDFRDFLHLDFHECLLKSKSTEHLVLVFKFSPKDFFSNVEYNHLDKKIGGALQEPEYYLPQQIYATGTNFCQFILNKDYEVYSWRIVRIMKSVISLFENDSSRELGSRKDIKFDMIYNMACFSLKYHPEIFKKIFKDEKAAKLFSLKLNIVDSALRRLRSSREIEFFGSNGLWSSELSFVHSEHAIPLKQVINWKPSTGTDVKYFAAHFRCFIQHDFDYWEKHFVRSSLERIKSGIHSTECVNKCALKGKLSSFGTNFSLIENADKESLGEAPMISGVFLNDLYTWIQRLQILAERNREDERIWNEIDERMSSAREENTKADIQEWFKASDFLSFVIWETKENLAVARYSWDQIKGYMEQLNQNIKLFINKSAQEVSYHSGGKKLIHPETFGKSNPVKQRCNNSFIPNKQLPVEQGLIIPDINF